MRFDEMALEYRALRAGLDRIEDLDELGDPMRDRMTALAREMAQGASGSIRDLVSKTEVLMDWLDPNGSAWGRQAHPTERQTVTFRQLDDVWNITAIGAKPEK